MTWTLPASLGTAGQVLATDAAGSLSWVTGTGGGGGSGDFMSTGTVSMTGQFKALSGNSATPGISFAADVDTGIFNAGANSLAFATGGQERLRLDSNGYVGIGTTTPSGFLDVSPPYLPAGTGAGITLKSQDSGNNAGDILIQGGNAANQGGHVTLQTGDGSGGQGAGTLKLATGIGGVNDASIEFWTAGLFRMRVNRAGNVGIGTTDPVNKLEVVGGAIAAGSQSTTVAGEVRFYDLGASGNNFVAFRAPSSLATNLTWTLPASLGTAGQVLSTDAAGSLSWVNGGGGSAAGSTGHVQFNNGGAFAASANLFWNNGSSRLGIGTATPSESLETTGNMKAVNYYSTSDRRLKTEIRPIEGLDIIRRLNGVRYKWMSTKEDDFGLIAQDVEAVLPEAVATNADGLKSVKYPNLVSPIIQAVKEVDNMCRATDEDLQATKSKLDRRIANLESENEKLQKQNEELANRLDRLEKLIEQKK